MKKILYFVAGILIAFILAYGFAPLAQAAIVEEYECAPHDDIPQIDPGVWGWCAGTGPIPAFSNYAAAMAHVGTKTWGPTNAAGNWKVVGNYNTCKFAIYPYYQAQMDVCLVPPPPDTDGDGIDDECDLYTNDPTPHTYSIISEVKSNTTDEQVYMLIKTDLGDIRYFGTYPEDMTGYTDTVHLFPESKANSTLCLNESTQAGTVTATVVPSTEYYSNIQDAIQAATPPGDADVPGVSTASDGTETDNEALQKIIDNTDATTQNIGVLADYLKSINDNIGELNKKDTARGVVPGVISPTAATTTTTGSGTTTTAEDVQTGVEDALAVSTTETDSAITGAGDTDAAFTEAQGAITGTASLEADAPDEFKEKTDITEKIDGYIENSGFLSIITGTGITTSGASPTLTYSYKGRPITLTVAGFESELHAFGLLLIAMSTLSGMLLIFRG